MLKSLLGACLAALPLTANAALLERLGGLAYYDTEANLTWLADANAAAGSVFDTSVPGSGTMSWDNANLWAAGLNINGTTGWRLPDTLYPDSSCDAPIPNGEQIVKNCRGSEMGNLFYNVLGGSDRHALQDLHNENYYLFSNIQNSAYWSSEYNADRAWYFLMHRGGGQYNGVKFFTLNAWAVHDGDIGAVPVPAAVWLFGSGLIGLIGLARRKA